jgi:tetratricopeptide (TPR) repeat protein
MSFWQKLFGQKSGGTPGQDSQGLTREQIDELAAKPIPRNRMDLLWLDPQTFEIIAIAGGANVLTDDGAGGARALQCTPEDLKWAKEVHAIAAKAQSASERGDYRSAIQHYREALKSAPGCDLYLMSVGCGYARMGHTKIGIQYLERAAEISPDNARIRNNLVQARRAI